MTRGEYLGDGLTISDDVPEVGALANMTLVYNSHRTPEHAAQTAEQIMPDSMIFLEGFNMCDPLGPYGQLSAIMNNARLQYGKEHAEYQEAKQLAISVINKAFADYKTDKEDDFSAHTAALFQEVLDKDCLFYFADYPTPGILKLWNRIRRPYRQMDKANHPINITPDLNIRPWQNGGRQVRKIEQNTRRYVWAQCQREFSASQIATLAISEVSQMPGKDDLACDSDGRLMAFMSYGIAHKKSLTAHVTRFGFTPGIVTLKDRTRQQIIDPVHIDETTGVVYHPNFRQRVGYIMLEALFFRAFDTEMGSDNSQQFFDKLAWLNAASDETYQDFTRDCARASRAMWWRSPKNETKYQSFIDEYVASE